MIDLLTTGKYTHTHTHTHMCEKLKRGEREKPLRLAGHQRARARKGLSVSTTVVTREVTWQSIHTFLCCENFPLFDFYPNSTHTTTVAGTLEEREEAEVKEIVFSRSFVLFSFSHLCAALLSLLCVVFALVLVLA